MECCHSSVVKGLLFSSTIWKIKKHFKTLKSYCHMIEAYSFVILTKIIQIMESCLNRKMILTMMSSRKNSVILTSALELELNMYLYICIYQSYTVPKEFFAAIETSARFVVFTCKNVSPLWHQMVPRGMLSVMQHAVAKMRYIFLYAIFAILKATRGKRTIFVPELTTTFQSAEEVSLQTNLTFTYIIAHLKVQVHHVSHISKRIYLWCSTTTTNYWMWRGNSIWPGMIRLMPDIFQISEHSTTRNKFVCSRLHINIIIIACWWKERPPRNFKFLTILYDFKRSF